MRLIRREETTVITMIEMELDSEPEEIIATAEITIPVWIALGLVLIVVPLVMAVLG